jgi:hypothetical protein
MYCMSNFFLNTLECSLLCVLSHIHLLATSGGLFSQLLTEHNNLAVVLVVVAVVVAAAGVLQTEALIESVPD